MTEPTTSLPADHGARTPRRAVAIASLLGATLFWAGHYVVGASAVASIDPLSLVVLRWAIALVPLLAIAQLVERPRWRQVLAAWPWLLVLSLLGMLGYSLLLYAALERTDPLSASLVNAFNPALITLAAALFLRERLTPAKVTGVAVALVGVLVVLSGGDLATLLDAGPGAGERFMIGAIVAWTGYTIVGRRAPALPPMTATAVQAAMTLAVVTPISLVHGITLPSSPETVAALLYIAIFPSMLSYLLWNQALSILPAGSAGVFLNLITVFTVVLSVLAGHRATAAQLIGGLIVIGGVVIANISALRGRTAGTQRTG